LLKAYNLFIWLKVFLKPNKGKSFLKEFIMDEKKENKKRKLSVPKKQRRMGKPKRARSGNGLVNRKKLSP